MSTRRTGPLLVLLTFLACDGDAGEECEPSDSPSSLAIDNRSSVAIDSIIATPCDGGAGQELALPDGGIEFASQAEVELPGSGCWQLTWSGEGCTNETPYRTPDICGGDSYAWTVSVEGRVCEGGW